MVLFFSDKKFLGVNLSHSGQLAGFLAGNKVYVCIITSGRVVFAVSYLMVAFIAQVFLCHLHSF